MKAGYWKELGASIILLFGMMVFAVAGAGIAARLPVSLWLFYGVGVAAIPCLFIAFYTLQTIKLLHGGDN